MIGFNHALVGGLIGKFLPLPLALPLALASHFIIDTFPHYGLPQRQRDRSTFWKVFFHIDFFATLLLAVFALSTHHYAMLISGFVAVAPDFVWVARFLKTKSFNMAQANSPYERWHRQIQHYEFPNGIYIELPLAAILFYFVYGYLTK